MSWSSTSAWLAGKNFEESKEAIRAKYHSRKQTRGLRPHNKATAMDMSCLSQPSLNGICRAAVHAAHATGLHQDADNASQLSAASNGHALSPHHMPGGKRNLCLLICIALSPLGQAQDRPVQEDDVEDHACAKECCAEVEEGCRRRRQSGKKDFGCKGKEQGWQHKEWPGQATGLQRLSAQVPTRES